MIHDDPQSDRSPAPQTSSDSTPSAPQIIAPVSTTSDDRIDTDLLCWQCQYNLRTLSRDAGCPECGYSVAESVERGVGLRARRFSLHSLPPASQVFGWVVGVLVPAGVVLLASGDPMKPINVDWQSGNIEDYVGTMLAGRAMWAFYPFLFWSYAALASLLLAPGKMGRRWWVRAGLILGVLLGVQYQLILTIHLGGPSDPVFGVLVGVVGAVVLAGIVAFAAMMSSIERQAGHVNPPLRPRTGLNKGIQITVMLLLCSAWVTIGIIFALILAPFGMAVCMLAALCRLYRTDFDEPIAPTRPIPVTITAAGYLAAWPVAVTQAQVVYFSLPTTPPGCYIVTASARGHRWLTRPIYIAVDQQARAFPVTHQMLVLKQAEHAIAARWPGLHRAMRRVYDRVGPPIAARINNPWLADVSYLLFAVPACLAGFALDAPSRCGHARSDSADAP